MDVLFEAVVTEESTQGVNTAKESEGPQERENI